jgi:hypothetical protein
MNSSEVDIPTNPRTGKRAGYAFVSFATAEEARRAVGTLNGSTLLNRKVSVQMSHNTEAAALSEEGEIDEDQKMGNNETSAPSTNGAAPAQASTSSFSHLRNLHNVAASEVNGTSLTTSSGTSTQLQAQAATATMPQRLAPQAATIIPETTLEQARQMLAEIDAKDNAQLQSSGKGRGAPQGKKRKLIDGGITDTWTAIDRPSSTPWYLDHTSSPDTGYW